MDKVKKKNPFNSYAAGGGRGCRKDQSKLLRGLVVFFLMAISISGDSISFSVSLNFLDPFPV